MFRRRRPVHFANGRVVTGYGLARSIRVERIVQGIDAAPRADDVMVDLGGAFVLPGLVNAHDHLELNHYGPLKGRPRYAHANDWIDDLRPRLRDDAELRRNRTFSLPDRLFIGGLKNLLSGVTTVAHHNPRYAAIGRRFPVRVLGQYGWAHSYAMEGEPVGAGGEPGGRVRDRAFGTPAEWPFIVHLGEGVDDRARAEIRRFADEGCLRSNSVLVHGVGHTVETWAAAAAAGASVVWCPASNDFLLGGTLALGRFFDAVPGSERSVCLGTDSRLTGGRDLLDELRQAAATPAVAGKLLPMVTTSAARILRLGTAGRLDPGLPADLTIVPPDPAHPDDPERALLMARRRDVQLVMVDGQPLVGEPALAAVFAARRVATAGLVVDGADRVGAAALVRRLAVCAIREPGVEVRA